DRGHGEDAHSAVDLGQPIPRKKTGEGDPVRDSELRRARLEELPAIARADDDELRLGPLVEDAPRRFQETRGRLLPRQPSYEQDHRAVARKEAFVGLPGRIDGVVHDADLFRRHAVTAVNHGARPSRYANDAVGASCALALDGPDELVAVSHAPRELRGVHV